MLNCWLVSKNYVELLGDVIQLFLDIITIFSDSKKLYNYWLGCVFRVLIKKGVL